MSDRDLRCALRGSASPRRTRFEMIHCPRRDLRHLTFPGRPSLSQNPSLRLSGGCGSVFDRETGSPRGSVGVDAIEQRPLFEVAGYLHEEKQRGKCSMIPGGQASISFQKGWRNLTASPFLLPTRSPSLVSMESPPTCWEGSSCRRRWDLSRSQRHAL